MLSVLLLCAAVALGSSRDYETVLYGEGFRIWLSRRAHTLTFWTGPDDVVILWTSENGSASRDPRHSVDGSYFVMTQMTQRDNGQYDLWDKNDYRLSSVDISIRANEQAYNLDPGDSVNFEHDLPFTSCNVFFTPEDHLRERAELVHQGRVLHHRGCESISVNRPCKFIIVSADTSCSGTYEMKDNDDDTAMLVTVTVRDDDDGDSYGWFGIAAFMAPALCYCMKCCCCGKSSKKKASSDSEGAEDAAADADPTQCASEPVRPGPTISYPAAPPLTPSAPLIHNSYDSQPPSYEEAMAMTEGMGGSLPLFTSTAEPRVELTDVKF